MNNFKNLNIKKISKLKTAIEKSTKDSNSKEKILKANEIIQKKIDNFSESEEVLVRYGKNFSQDELNLLKKKFSNNFKNRKFVFNKDDSIYYGLRIFDHQKFYDFTLDDKIDDFFERLETVDYVNK